jgi:hypothetical protein
LGSSVRGPDGRRKETAIQNSSTNAARPRTPQKKLKKPRRETLLSGVAAVSTTAETDRLFLDFDGFDFI